MRSGFVLCASLACALLSSAFTASAAGAPSADIAARDLKTSDFPRWQQLVPNVYAYEGLHSPDRDGTVINTVSMIVVTPQGVVVLDGQGDLEQTKAMIANIRKLSPQPIKYVVIASDHTDHVGGNAAFKEAYPDVVFIASPASQKVLAQKGHPAMETVSDRRTLRLGNTEIQVMNLGRAHTGGDLVAYLPDSKVLFLGEVYLRGVFPAMRTAYPSEWLATIDKAQKMDVSWYVPGHGFVDTETSMRIDLEESKKALAHVIAEAKRLHAAGRPCESAANCPAAREAQWGPYADYALSTSQGPLAITKVYQELEGRLP